jgi:hypothetical protein
MSGIGAILSPIERFGNQLRYWPDGGVGGILSSIIPSKERASVTFVTDGRRRDPRRGVLTP